ncbi:MAG: aspartate carbamoyltransferase [Candidatus Buchananbacteria bacterium RBG_13_39_9]|uniref:Aspartate carbamoyltransferase n=1 Tax=Candidatus Buchananbacteria bacterium RBG_13_39_9 TaxID=1797531 RepID=A0A1G1XP02_9BACT|nr:MAG: aspartate carbamoyltransferase [Candidatus Buchananbacteria bacterium RBG_13_39_9]
MNEWWGEHDGIDFPHVVLSQQFDRKQLEQLFKLTFILKEVIGKGTAVNWLNGKILAAIFYEASTRTRLSFETAALRLGAQVISSENAKEFSSAIKGETLEDTVRIISSLADIMVLRHSDDDAAERAAKVPHSIPILNGGSGKGQHPTQALLDVFTIHEHFCKVEGLKVAMVGDLLRGRTVRSLTYMLSKFAGVEITFVAPAIAQIKLDIKDHLAENGIKWQETEDFREVAKEVDVIYMTRYQLERTSSQEEKSQLAEASHNHRMTSEVANSMKSNAIILHPLPRIEEIRWNVDNNPRAKYFQQAANGVFVRMALLLAIFNPAKARELL